MVVNTKMKAFTLVELIIVLSVSI
ncbi:prepilin-type N-terminal cleavage/methylation domain-containing protein [Idiomarina sp.]